MMGRMGTEGAGGFRLIAGRYRLEERVGRGGMGVVWRASDEVLGRRVAVKEFLPDDSLPDDDARRRRERTFREARAVCQLRHPHIIVVHDVVEHDGRPYLVMELVDGPSLAERIAQDGPVGPAEAARIGIALLSAVHTAHEAGVLHRDIKPANVLIESGTDRVVLTDFGIAQVEGATTLTETGSFVGSPEYTAPERMSGLRTGPESDLWSLGALLCTALSGESPFRRDSLGGILHAVVSAEIRPPAEAEPLLPVVLGLLERDPDLRLGAADAERMLRTYLETGRTPAAPGGHRPAGAHGIGRLHRIGGRTHKPPVAYSPTRPDLPEGVPPPPGPAHPTAQPPPARPAPRGALVASLLVAALAGAGVSAAVLLLHQSGGAGDGTPGGTATTPATGTTGTPPFRRRPLPHPGAPAGPAPARTPRPPATARPTTRPASPRRPGGLHPQPARRTRLLPLAGADLPPGRQGHRPAARRPPGRAGALRRRRPREQPRLPRRPGHPHHARRTPGRLLGVHLERLQRRGGPAPHLRPVLGGERQALRRVGVGAGRQGPRGTGVLRRGRGHLLGRRMRAVRSDGEKPGAG